MIKTFKDKRTQQLFVQGSAARVPAELARQAARRLDYIEHATCLEDLRVPPSNGLHALRGDRRGQYAIRVNKQWRICFRFESGDAYDVEFTDYH